MLAATKRQAGEAQPANTSIFQFPNSNDSVFPDYKLTVQPLTPAESRFGVWLQYQVVVVVVQQMSAYGLSAWAEYFDLLPN